ncbi:MAG: hypothetical protein I8H76_10575, partial [Burkholderiales bacterium]|nr:hypothetical protein [Burkholderiales bacterium]
MSTSEFNGLTPPGASLPDVQALAQLANRFFSALPGSPPSGPTAPGGLPPGLSHLSAPSVAQPAQEPPPFSGD